MAGAPPTRAELDFADVFGGPPRRSSGNERPSRRGSMDSSSFESSAPRARSGGPETPVFGDRGSGDRRRQLGEEFYRDIFPGSETASPRRPGAGDWGDVFGGPASPGSAARPRSSFSMKFNRGTDSSMPTSPSWQTSNRNDDGTSYDYSVPTSSPNSQLKHYLAQEEPQQDSRKKPSSWHPPFLSRFRSQNGDKKNTSNYVSSMESEGEGTHVSYESIMASNKFHFSFYKWAGKGTLLVLPATTEDKDAAIIGLRSFPQVVVQEFDLIDEEDSMSTATGASKSQTDYEDSKSGKHSTSPASKEGPMALFFDDYMQGRKHSTDYSKNDVSSYSPSAKSSQSASGEKHRSSRVKRKVKDFMKIFSLEDSPKRKGAPEAQDQTSSVKKESKTELQDKFTISSSEANEDVITIQMNNQNAVMPSLLITGGRKDKIDNTVDHGERYIEDLDGCLVEHLSADPSLHNNQEKEQIKLGGYSKNGVSSDSPSAKSSRSPSLEKSHSGRVKGKVKGFMKIFSPKGSPKRKGAPDAQDQTSSVKNESKTELQDKFTVSSSEADEDVKTTQMSNQNAFMLSPMSEGQERLEKPVLISDSKMDTNSARNEAVPNELITGGRNDNLDNIIDLGEIYVEDLDVCLVEHISEDPVLHNDQEKEQIKIAESKIREWSRGKEGNIRSLLSTLQYVLWPESGWKPIPLVDVIEGAAVKKAYQKALLCLHPDKLQQRRAAMHQKYIAEKVFDILQESWKEFNSVTFG
ncbi:hypothetical protein EJB05_07692 [Eragrostis curvula]|uniref:J domain-containing protein n=1 Tax=Eragrostis curvula TaxID=38414 RepID=A0A5J9WL54_9POAL|nr:hypothetical protein EJB05_07692 [Eragrostis curvula]